MLATVMAAAAVMAVAACGSSSRPAVLQRPEKPDVVVAVVPAEAQAGLYIAQAEGLFARVGLHVTIKPVVSGLDVIPAMLHGSVDITGGQYPSFIGAEAAGIANMHILAAGFSLGPNVNEVLAAPSAHIRSPAGLKGKTIAVNALNSVSADLVYTALAPYGITPAQVHLVVLPFPAMPAALATGKITAAYLTEPFVTEAVRKYGAEEVADLDSGPTQNLPLTGYGVLASWAARYPRTAAAFARAVQEGNTIAATNLATLQQVLGKVLHLSPDISGVMATGSFPTSVNAVQVQRVADLMLQYGQLKHRFNVNALIGG
jgi:NitT/TauT family transport system substrate-binding protein